MILRIFDYFCKHRLTRWGLLTALTMMLLLFISRLSYQEDITDFLPLGTTDREALSVYQDISGAGELIVIFDNPDDPDLTVEAIQTFTEEFSSRETLGISENLMVQFDNERIAELADFVYNHIPYFLTDADYQRMDSLLSQPDYVERQLEADRELLMFPSGGLLTDNIGRDPLNLFTPVAGKLSQSQKQSHFETYDGYIFSPDMKKALALLPSPYGNSETNNNAKLVALLDSSIVAMQKAYPTVKAHVTGGPEIAVGNARQIKNDSILAVSISVILILILLMYAFRSSRNIALVVVSISWGWIFALGCITLIHSTISIIVIGISSIIIGIAVNYPLHLIDHTSHEPNLRTALREIVVPLLVGNVTTIGAFLALVPLKSVALRDLGLFASLLLLGTIAFVLLFLPHMVKAPKRKEGNPHLFGKLAEAKLENKPLLVGAVVVLTIFFGWFSLGTQFDSNMAHINYMTPEQRADMDYFSSLTANDTTSNSEMVYVLSSAETMDKALENSELKEKAIDSLLLQGKVTSAERLHAFVTSNQEQNRRLEKWKAFTQQYASVFQHDLQEAANKANFTDDAFQEFYEILNSTYEPMAFDGFAPITQTVYKVNISISAADHRYSVIDKLNVRKEDLQDVKGLFPGSFDVQSMNGAMANSLSNDFNYIGLACSLIVFFFLWFSFGRIELAIISFLPMAISWVWILGIMTLLGIKFNIVNVILATFIFGQGDDYTIFITEGCSYEYAYRKPMLASYKNSIILSALIMFVGIGSLIVAKHPALLSLAEVTIIGMFSVVLMAYLVPPFCFKWLTRKHGNLRERPLTLVSLFQRKKDEEHDAAYFKQLVCDRYLYKGVGIRSAVKKSLASTNLEQLQALNAPTIRVKHNGYGAVSLWIALIHPDKQVVAYEDDEEKRLLAIYCAEGIAPNLRVEPLEAYISNSQDVEINLEEK